MRDEVCENFNQIEYDFSTFAVDEVVCLHNLRIKDQVQDGFGMASGSWLCRFSTMDGLTTQSAFRNLPSRIMASESVPDVIELE